MARRKAAGAEGKAAVSVGGEPCTDEQRLKLLEQAVNRQLDYILKNEVADLASRIRDIKAAMDMIRTIRNESAAKGGDARVEISFLD